MAETTLAARAQTPALSLCMIVKNEEKYLARCLASVQGVVDEIILVDTGSTDRTVEIAQTYGARVFQHTWQDDFAEARNASLGRATGDWILHLDADEELEPGARARLRSVIAATDADGVLVCLRSFFPPTALTRYVDVQWVRLFRHRPGFCYELPLHEQILPSIRRQKGHLVTSDLVIWHHGYVEASVQGGEDRMQRNCRVLEKELRRSPQNAFLCASLGMVYHDAGRPTLAEIYLRRAMELGAADLPKDMLAEVLSMRATIAHDKGDWRAALDFAQASVRLEGTGIVNALNLLGQVCLKLGEEELRNALEAVQARSNSPAEASAQIQAGKRLLSQSHAAFQQALAALLRLRQHPQLNATMQPGVERALHHCQARLQSTAAALQPAR